MSDTEGELVGHYSCPDCGSDDNLAIYEKEDGTFDGNCFTPDCGFKSNNTLADCDWAEELGIKKKTRSVVRRKVERRTTKKTKKKEKQAITPAERFRLYEDAGFKGKGYRKIEDPFNRLFGVRTEFDEKTGKPVKRYYPCTQGFVDCKPNLVGYKVRAIADKAFFPIGRVSKDCDLFGQWLCKGTKYLLIAGGEEDAIAAKQMLNSAKKDNWAEVDVVSSIIGEGSVAEQCKGQYDFIDRYDNIILNMDMDEAGEKAVASLLDTLPAGKVKVMSLPEKDACDMLAKDLGDDFVRAFYSASKPKVAGIADSSEIISAMKESTKQEKIPLPAFLASVNKAMVGGYLESSFNIIAAQTSVGKSTVANEVLYSFIDNDIKTGLISLEGSKGYVGEQLGSLHLNKRLADIEDSEERLEVIEEAEEELHEFFNDGEGNSNLFILDDRSLLDDIDSTFKNIEKLIRVCGIRVLIVDVLSDLMDTMSNEEQADFMGRIKKLIARHSICIIGIMHMRKPSDKRDPHDVSEFDIYGSSTAIKSAHSVLLLSRDKLAEDEDDKNTTRVKLSKNRGVGRTGRMCDIFYNYRTGRLVEKKDGGF